MVTEQRMTALKGFGYDEQEAAFLCMAALTSGYFLRRQFAALVESKQGRRDTTFAAKTIQRGHAHLIAFRHNRMLYHLHGKPLYDALGAVDNRNRRKHHVFTIKNRV